MMWNLYKLFCFFCLTVFCEAFVTSYLSNNDRERIKQVFDTSLATKELAATHYAILGYKELKKPLPNENEVCSLLRNSLGTAPTVETVYQVVLGWKAIGSCQGSLPTDVALKVATDTVNSDTSNLSSLYYGVATLKALGKPVPQIAKLVKNIQALLKKDDSVINFGYSFHIGSLLGQDGAFVFDRIEDALVQADEIDTKYLQFEGGLSITAFVMSGVYNLATSLNKTCQVSGEQAVKFANYFLSRKSVQMPKGAYSLLNILNIYSNNKFHVPIVMTMVGGGVLSREDPKLTVKVTNVLGEGIASTTPFQLTLESLARQQDATIIASKKKFQQSSQDKMLFSLIVADAKTEAGVYLGKVSVTGGDSRLVGTVNVALTMRMTTTVVLEQVKLGKADSDLSTQPSYETLSFPGGKLSQPLDLDLMQKLSIRFNVKDKGTGKPMTVHQAFLKFTHSTTKQELIYLIEHDSSFGSYKLDIDMGNKGSVLGRLSGVYTIELLIGDIIMSNPFCWFMGETRIKVPDSGFQPTLPSAVHSVYLPKPEIKHIFRQPEKRPPSLVSNLFSGLVLLPFLILFILWIKIGINFSNFPISLSCIGFHLGLGGIFGLFSLFWLSMNMFDTLKYLTAVCPFTFLCGIKTLSKLAEKKKN